MLMVDLVGRAALRRGLTTTEAVDRWYDHHADEVGPRTGARAVARVWSGAARNGGAGGLGDDLGRCACGRVWRAHHDTDTVRNVVLPGAPGCSGWPVLGVPPSWYRPRSEYLFETVTPDDPAVRTAIWTDSPRTHHLVVPRVPAGETRGPADLESQVGRAALRGVPVASADPAPPGDPEWARALPGYVLDERLLDHPWELRALALVLAIGTDRPGLRSVLVGTAVSAPVDDVGAGWVRAAAEAVRLAA